MRHPAVLLLTMIVAAGCAVGPDYMPPATDMSSTFEQAEAGNFDALQADANWWRLLQDPQLDALIEQAMRENHDVRIAAANVARSRAFLSRGLLERFPIVTAQGGVTRQETSIAITSSPSGRDNTFYDASLDASWELDFFGRVRRGNQALAADFEATLADQRNAFVVVAAEVARTYIELLGSRYRLQVARRNASNQQQTYALTKALLDGGRGTDLDLARAQAQLESTLATIPPLEADIVAALNRLGVLVGREPAALQPDFALGDSLPALPEQLHIGAPTELLRRRPDIVAAERRLAAATARVGVATGDLFPRVTVAGSAGYLATDRSDFGNSGTMTSSIGPFLSWRAFDLGRVRAGIRAADAETEGQLAVFEQTVLRALEETENALSRFARNRQRLAHLGVAAEASSKAADLANVRYRNGVDSFLNVLDAEARRLEAEDALARSETDTGLALVTLYKALGGGWEVIAE